MTRWRTCRFCDRSDDERALLKYEVRHYAHARCLLKAKGAAAWRVLPIHELGKMPFNVAEENGILGDVLRAIRSDP